MSIQKPKSILWYLLPAFFAVIGGIIAFIILRKSDPKKAKNCAIIGLAASGFAIAFDLITDTFDLLVGDYVEMYGISDFMGGASIFVVPPIIIGYYVIVKIKNKAS